VIKFHRYHLINITVSPGVSICLNRVSMESLDLDSPDFLDSSKTTSWKSRFYRQFKNQVSTVSITQKIVISQFLLRSWSRVLILTVWKWHLDSWDFLDSLKNNISMCRDISISIALDCQDPQAYITVRYYE